MPRTVLVVDDDPVFRDLARRTLVDEGLVVVGEADRVTAATTAAQSLRPDAVLVDVGLPDGDGITLARELTALPWRPLIVLTSTDPDAATPDEVHSCGAIAFVAKGDLPNASLAGLLTAS